MFSFCFSLYCANAKKSPRLFSCNGNRAKNCVDIRNRYPDLRDTNSPSEPAFERNDLEIEQHSQCDIFSSTQKFIFENFKLYYVYLDFRISVKN